MKRIKLLNLCLLFSIILSSRSNAQKPIIDLNVLNKWSLNVPELTNNGTYSMAVIEDKITGTFTLDLRSTSSSWQMVVRKIKYPYSFTADSKKVFFTSGNDSLCELKLGTDSINYRTTIKYFSLSGNQEEEWLGYTKKEDTVNNVMLIDLLTGKTLPAKPCVQYSFSRDGKSILLETRSKDEQSNELYVSNLFNGRDLRLPNISSYNPSDEGNVLLATTVENNRPSLHWVDLQINISLNIWTGSQKEKLLDFNFDKQETQLIFMIQGQKPDTSLLLNTLYYYKKGMPAAILKVGDESSNMPAGMLLVRGRPLFTRNGRYITFYLTRPLLTSQDLNSPVGLNIWSYKDRRLNSEQRLVPETIQAVIASEGSKVISLQDENEEFTFGIDDIPGDYIVACDHHEVNLWWPANKPDLSYWLVCLKDGSRKILKENAKTPLSRFNFSPEGHWLVYWDSTSENWFSYDLLTAKFKNLTQGLPPVSREKEQLYDFINAIYAHPIDNIAGWFAKDEYLLLYDRYDLWKIDPSGAKSPSCITSGYGATHHVKLRLLYENIYKGDEQLLFTGFNTLNKYNGFFSKKMDRAGDPLVLTMGPYVYYQTVSQVPHIYIFGSGILPLIKGPDNNRHYIVQRCSATEFPNYYFTTDFKQYRPLTDYQPQKEYNWLTSSLITWKQLDGTSTEGVLYKPENFDPHKKYPVIFNYYEHYSQRLYGFPTPQYIQDNVDIPWFVSRGYLVVAADIQFSVANTKKGKLPGEAACNSIIAAAHYMASLPYVDSTKMAIQGHSFGGGETNYLVTHSNIFAAACSASATVSDEISAYLGMISNGNGIPRPYRINHVNGHDMIGATLWERPDLYIKASPVFKADKVTTPLLMMQCQADDGWEQGTELYMALRRLGKKVWMLDYNGEGHVLAREEDAQDFTIRLTQFFDHYLKGTAPPKWMTQPQYSYDGLKAGLELDRSGTHP